MAVRVHELVLCKCVLELGEGSFDARNTRQTLVALLVAGMVGRRSIGTLRCRAAGPGRPVFPVVGYFVLRRAFCESRRIDDNSHGDQYRSSEDAKREQPPSF